MLMAVPISYTSTGFGTRWDNVGAMRNRGVEINVGADVLRIKDFKWNVNANVSYNKNEITELYNGVTEYVASDTGRMVAVGHPLGEFYLNRYAGVNPINGDALWYTKDGEITAEYNESDKVMLGKHMKLPGKVVLVLHFPGRDFHFPHSSHGWLIAGCLTTTESFRRVTDCSVPITSQNVCFTTDGKNREM